MTRIQILPSDLANQIAAGEVVERPASVIKELIENSIDAGARRVSVAIEFGGKRRMYVEDDGDGMGPDDVRLAVERHATSKVSRSEDLEGIATLGFRGEALPSIASVSHFVLRSRPRGADSGTEIRINGGTVSSVTEVGMSEGTSLEITDLFYNLPARRKFLKSDGAESGQISRVVTQLALCYPEIGFTLTNGKRTVVQCPPVPSLHDRLFQLYGERLDLVEVRREGDVEVVGYVAALAEHGPKRGPQHVFVNRRIVKDRTIAHAIIEAYSVASIKERSPEVHLFISMPPTAVDVNVHPTKAEVRFRNQSHIHEVIRRTLGDALGRGPAPELHLEGRRQAQEDPGTLPLPSVYPGTFPSRWTTGSGGAGSAGGGGGVVAEALAHVSSLEGLSSVAPSSVAPSTPTQRPMVALGQFRDTFIIAVDDEGIAIVDQHVAHERVLFERIVERLTTGTLDSQRLLEPMLIDMSAAARQALSARTAELARMGFELEAFGGDTLRVSAVPVLLRREECEAALHALADDLEGLDGGSAVEEAIKRIAATMACHAAVKANDPLTPEKMAHILEELRQTAYSTICPHGRPVMLRLTRREVEKNFQRI
ncbi:MAG: DNA mismatch repair endonuclease MutL [Acidobacteria bacterium]|nr:DNA mismatch repair endonuclease MutL [Acidobacteriota bacterium]